jgi:hypothetical protein
LAKFDNKGKLVTLTSLLGFGHNVIADLVVDDHSRSVYVTGIRAKYAASCQCSFNILSFRHISIKV